MANKVKELIGCSDWDRATQEQLEKRDYLYGLIADFTEANKDPSRGFVTAIELFKRKEAQKLKATL